MSRLLILGLGAALMFFGDPKAGRERRSAVSQRLDSTRRLIEQRGEVIHEAATKTQEVLAGARTAIAARDLSGPTLGEIARDTVEAWRRPDWSPAQRATAGAFGAAVSMLGYLRGGVKGMAWCAVGGALIARATANDAPGSVRRA